MRLELTKSQVNKAGRTLRRYERDRLPTDSEYLKAIEVMVAFRADHQYPLVKANNGLRSALRTEGCEVSVSQRLKRAHTILDKLMREPTMQLANMQDIGGCRAILRSVDEIRRVERRIKKNRPIFRVADYIGQPRASGYRGVHVIVEYDGRAVEVQLRTPVMHEWAITVETLSGRLQEDLKGGFGPPVVLEFLEAISEAMAIEERGQVVDEALQRRIAELRQRALPLISGGPR